MRDLEKKGGIKEVIKDGCIVKCLNLIPKFHVLLSTRLLDFSQISVVDYLEPYRDIY